MTSTRRTLKLELLESRHLLSGSQQYFLASTQPTAGAPNSDDAPVSSESEFIAPLAASADSRWDWLAGTDWYVPRENLLAYSAPPDLSDPRPISDQTLWHFSQSSGGQIAGNTTVKLSSLPVPTQLTFTGIVTPAGQIRMEFLHSSGTITTGIGQMRFIDGAWQAEMQMATGSSNLITHWAYMAQSTLAVTPPEPGDTTPPGSLRAENWRWLEGTNWALRDSQLFPSGDHAGVFGIDSFDDGYYWGSGTSNEPFNVLGSVTPEGNLLLLISVNGAQPDVRTGVLADGVMLLRTYEGNPAVGIAWLLDSPAIGSARRFLASTPSLSSP
jgi:hypothetical protein